MLTESEILDFITQDTSSAQKRAAEVGLRYYEGEHDIRNYRLYYYDANGNIREDKNRSNIKISHPFFTELVDQQVQYMLSGGSFIRSDEPALQNALNEYFNDNDDFLAELNETITGAVAKGWEYMYAYRNAEGRLAFQCADSLNVIEVDAKYTSDNRNYIIYHYLERIDKDNRKVQRVQVWDDEKTYYYTRIDSGKLVADENDPANGIYNPRPHVIYKKSNDDNTYYEGCGFIPFFRLDNCRKRFSALKPVKALIDDYDLMSCGLSNNLQDSSEYLVVVKGFNGENLEELMQNIKTKKHIGVSGDDGGGVEYKTVDIPYEARKVKLELDESNIYRFGMGFNSAQVGDGNITNVVIRSRYALLDLKCNKLEARLRQFLRKILQVVLDEINKNEKTAFTIQQVYFDFTREIMTNATDNAQIELTNAQRRQADVNTLLAVQSVLGDETTIKELCSTLDLDYEEVVKQLPDPEEEVIQLYGGNK